MYSCVCTHIYISAHMVSGEWCGMVSISGSSEQELEVPGSRAMLSSPGHGL